MAAVKIIDHGILLVNEASHVVLYEFILRQNANQRKRMGRKPIISLVQETVLVAEIIRFVDIGLPLVSKVIGFQIGIAKRTKLNIISLMIS